MVERGRMWNFSPAERVPPEDAQLFVLLASGLTNPKLVTLQITALFGSIFFSWGGVPFYVVVLHLAKMNMVFGEALKVMPHPTMACSWPLKYVGMRWLPKFQGTNEQKLAEPQTNEQNGGSQAQLCLSATSECQEFAHVLWPFMLFAFSIRDESSFAHKNMFSPCSFELEAASKEADVRR